MNIQKYRHPLLFFGLTTLIPWLCWFAAGYLSHITPGNNLYTVVSGILAFLGLLGPMIIAFALMLPDRELRSDLFNRLFSIKKIKPIYLFLTLFLMLISILLAQAISLLFGYSTEQFQLSSGSFTAGIFSVWFILIIAPIIEELAWHTYGTDCLRQRFSLFKTSMLFAVYWALWHFPLSGIKGYYQANLAESWIHSLNFAVSLIPYVLLMNWLYYKTDRNILVAIVFHITAGLFNEMFLTHPDSKVIQTILLLILTVFIVVRERAFFFQREYPE